MFPELTRDDVYRLETARLWLRWPRISDARAIQTLAGEKAVAGMTSHIPHPYPVGEAERFVLSAREQNAEGLALRLVITQKGAGGEVLGMIGMQPDGAGSAQIGYWLGKPHWGRGVATEAAQAVIDAAFTWTEISAITAGVFLANPSSRRVLEKSGFQNHGLMLCKAPARGGSVHADRYLLSRRNWASLKGWRAPIVEGLRIDARGTPQMEQCVAA
jgi:RimJ/RimL family protein N-acetyltransferase